MLAQIDSEAHSDENIIDEHTEKRLLIGMGRRRLLGWIGGVLGGRHIRSVEHER